MEQRARHLYEFGAYCLDPAERQLRRGSETIPLKPKGFETLLALVENSGHVLSKDELLKRIWPDTVVEEANLAQNIFILRKALGDDGESHAYIETVSKVGYRFVAPVHKVVVETHATAIEEGSLPVQAPGALAQTLRVLAAALMLVAAALWAGLEWKKAISAPENFASGTARLVDPKVRELYLRGRYFWNKRTAEGHLKAVEYFDQAVALDPSYAPAYAGLADAYALLASHEARSIQRTEAMTRARAAAQKALDLDETVAEAHASLAFVHLHFDWNWEAARKHFQRAIELNPTYPTAHHWYAYYWVAVGNLDQAIAEARRAHELDPLSVIISRDVCEMYFFAGRYDEAIAQCRKTLEMDPGFSPAHETLAFAYKGKGRQREFLEELKKKGGSQCRYLVYSGRKTEAQQYLDGLLKNRDLTFSPLVVAQCYSYLGQFDQAFEWLERTFRERDGALIVSRVDLGFERLRTDPRFEDVARRVGLPPLKR